MRAHVGKISVSRTLPCQLRVRRFEHALQRCLRRGICDPTPRLRPETLTCVSIHLLPSLLGGVTPASVIREILGEGEWTLCQNHGAASQRHARGRFVLKWKVWWILVNSSSPSTLIINSTGSWPLVVSITRATKGEFGYTNFESIWSPMMQLWRQSSSSPCHSSAATRQCSRVPLAFSPSSCWHGLPALQQYLVGPYREDTCAGWELLEYMVDAVVFVLLGVYMVAKLRSSDTGGSDVLTCSTIILSA